MCRCWAFLEPEAMKMVMCFASNMPAGVYLPTDWIMSKVISLNSGQFLDLVTIVGSILGHNSIISFVS